MTKIKIKKIEKLAARQVTFSKRRRGLFNKAQQLAVLCGVEVASIVFSCAGRPYVYSSSSMKDILSRYEMISGKSEEDELELLNRNHVIPCNEIVKISNEMRQMLGEDLEGLDMEQLQSLEDKMTMSLNRVREMKENNIMDEITILEQKRTQLIEENDKLRQILLPEREHVEEGDTMPEKGRLLSSPTSIAPLVKDVFSNFLELGLSTR